MSQIRHGAFASLSLSLPVLAAFAGSPANAAISFDPYATYPTGSYPEAVSLGDFNADGRTDVALVTSYYFDEANDYKLFIFLQGPAGELQPPVKYATSGAYTTRPQSVVTGDFNADGLDDVAVALNSLGVEVFLQDGAGAFQPPRLYTTEFSEVIASGDFNNDGRDDLVGVGWGGQNAGVMLQTESGELATPAVYSAPHGGYDDLKVGDINSDGLTDIVVMSGQSYAYDNLAVLTQNATGGLDGPVFYDVGGDVNTRGVAIGDVNGDGANDVIVTYGGNRPNARVGVFFQNAAGTLDPVDPLLTYDVPETVVADDLDGDQLADIAVMHGGWQRMGVYQQLPDGTLSPEELHMVPYASHYGPNGLVIGDINADGKSDAVIADYNYGLVVLRQSGAKADLALSLVDSRDPIILGEAVTYLMTVNNVGPSDATNVNAQLALPSGMEPINLPAGCSATVGTVVCTTETLVNGGTVDWSISVAANVSGTVTVSADVSASEVDPLPANNSVVETTTINATNNPPVADAGPDQVVSPRDVVTLDGSASTDADGWIRHYQWLQVSGPAVSWTAYDGVTAQFEAPRVKGREKSVTLEFILYVTDNKGAQTSDTVKVIVAR